MKKSKYNNLFCINNKEFFIYNALSNSFMEVDKEIINFLKDDEFCEHSISLEDLEDLKNANFVFDNDEEDDILLERLLMYNNRCSDKSILNLTIIPTLACNFNCGYCYEKKRPHITINDVTKDNIIKLISNQNHIKTISIQWYGGEPLLAFDKMVDITNRVSNIPFIKDNGVKIIADITTNGYLLDETIIEQLDKIFVKTIQITVDGIEETHNKRRPHLTNKDSYQKIITNISNLVKLQPEIIVHLRVNVDKENKDEFPILLKQFNDVFGLNKNIQIYPGFVQDTSACNTGAGCTLDTKNQLDFKLELFFKYGINIGYYPFVRDNICMAQHANSFVIDANGDITKCWLDVGRKDKVIGNINSKGFINHRLYTKYLTACHPFYDENCSICKIFPICGGGCQHDRIENKYFAARHNICSVYKNGLGELLYTHYLTKKINNNEK
ncbi:MAG: SPASM domain-containing protein [Bacteroidales bacterium]|jgi:uncharacterized protein|nr:SPASM domain-containing protein [Bacteroidales bacterium]